MHACDNGRISKIVDHLKNNQSNLQDQLKKSIQLNYETIRHFKETVKNIEHNENYLYILDYESIIDVHFQVDTNKINYFLSIPIDYEFNFELFYLLPIPTRHNSNFLTIIPNKIYFKIRSECCLRSL